MMVGDYRWNDQLRALNDILADLYPTKEVSRRVIDLAGLPPSLISFHDAALINWFNILEEARKRGRIGAVISVARQDFPDRDDLTTLAIKTGGANPTIARAASNAGLPASDRETEASAAPTARPTQTENKPVPAAPHAPSTSNAERGEQARQAAAENAVVVLVHGIRDFALWQNNIRSTLEEAGFKVEPTNYGRFNLIKFLLPIRFFRRQAIDDVGKQIRIIVHTNRNRPISIIAHSFGTFVVSHLIKEGFDLKFDRIIFCGSVVRRNFGFEHLEKRFSEPIVNEVGTRDVWPAVAESITTGYGSTGTYGFRRPLVRDRWHNGAGHGYFLTADFCRKFWVPFLAHGEFVSTAEEAESPKAWLQILSIFKVKYVLLALLAAAFTFGFDLPARLSELVRQAVFMREWRPAETIPLTKVARQLVSGQPLNVGSGAQYDGYRNPGCQAHEATACVTPQRGGKLIPGSGQVIVTDQSGRAGFKNPIESSQQYCVTFWANTGACETPVFIKGYPTATEEYTVEEGRK